MEQYKDIVKTIFKEGEIKENRTNVDTIAIAGAMFEHDMRLGFPLLTTKFIPFKLVSSELEFFIKGITDKTWLQNRNNHIWDNWCNPEKVPYNHDRQTMINMENETDLGPIYGWQWRNFGADYYDKNSKGIDQLKNVIDTLKTNPNDRRMIVSAWNPSDISKMALPPCHYDFQLTVINNKLNLMWRQRSVDVGLGLPFNIASYGLLLHLIAKETNLEEGKLIGFLGDVHIYTDHVDGLKTQLLREEYNLPTLQTDNFKSIFDWKYTDTTVINYKYHPKIKLDISI